MRPAVVLAAMYTLLEFAFVALMIAAAVVKTAEFGLLEYWQHFTNWSYTLQIVFYVGMLPVPLMLAYEVEDATLDALAGFAAVTFVPLWGIVTTVLLLVIAMLIVGSQLLEAFVGVVPVSDIVLGNEVFHFFTVFRLLTWAVINQRFVYYSLNQLFSHKIVHESKRVFVGLLAYQMLIGPSIPLLVYMSVFDWQTVYQTTTSFAVGLLGVLVSLLVATSPMLLFIFAFYLGVSPLKPRWMEESEFELTIRETAHLRKLNVL